MGILEVFRSKVAYIISVGAFVPAYYYLSSDRFKLKNDYQQEFVTQQFGTQNLSFAESAMVKNVNIAHSCFPRNCKHSPAYIRVKKYLFS